MPLFDYRCPAGHVTERLVAAGEAPGETPCGVCPEPAARQMGAPLRLSPQADTRGMYRRFVEASGEMDHAASRQGVPTPNLWAAAKQTVATIRS